MTLLEIAAVGIGGFFGAITRFFISKRMNDVKSIPYGTLAVNLIGSFLIGTVFGLELSITWTLFFASGLAGALTTFSTLNKEIIELWRGSKKTEAALYILVTYFAGIGFALIGYLIASK